MNPTERTRLMHAALDGEATPGETRELERLLAGNPAARAEYDDRYKFFSWIYRIAVNESLNLLRRNKREEALDDDVDLPGPERNNPESQFGEAEVSRRIRSALMNLPTNDRIVLSLRHFSECSYQEIGQILDLDEKTVKSRLYEARHRLRDVLKDLRPN